MTKIIAPVEGFNGDIAGVQFKDSVAETDNEAVISYCAGAGYTVEFEPAPPADPFDPAKHNAEEVLAYVAAIDDADPESHDAEVVRVVEAERAGKARKSVLEAIAGTPAVNPPKE